jgi:hypothetical protein
VRDFLKETSDSDDGDFAAAALRCLGLFIQWDVRNSPLFKTCSVGSCTRTLMP